jgi:hypothetical protein
MIQYCVLASEGRQRYIYTKTLKIYRKKKGYFMKFWGQDGCPGTDQKEKRVSACTELVAAVQRHSVAMRDQIVTVNETMVCYHTPETKRQSKQ